MNAIAMSTDAAKPVVEQIVPAVFTNIRHIPLSKLVPSAANVRRVNSTAGVSELADSIEAHGLIQNLTVRKAKKGDKFEVVAGARRLAALRLLVKEGIYNKLVEIPCKVLDDESDAEISLAENTQRETMHIVDEILGYRQLAENGMTPDTIAARFGQSVATVRQRLKLANLSPKILDAMREDELTIEQAKALAISDDHAEQESVWFERDHWSRQPQNLRSILTREHVPSRDRLARFVGIEAYEAAGGGIVRDLFAEDGTTFLTDRALLVTLATEKLEQAAEPLKIQGWKWIEISLDPSVTYNGGYGRIYPEARELTQDEQAELAVLGETFDALFAKIEAYAEGDPQMEAGEAQLYEIEQKIDAIRDAAKSYDPAEKALAGCIVTVAHNGTLQIAEGFVKAEDRAAVARLQDGGEDSEQETGDRTALPAAAQSEPETGYSAVLIEELTAIRTAALRIELVSRPEVALAAILHPLVAKVFYDGPSYWRVQSAIEISGQARDLVPSIKEPEACRALGEWTEIKDRWADHIPGNPGDLWEWLLEQPTDRLTDFLAVVTAANLNAVNAKNDHSRDRLNHADEIATALKLDMGQHWTPEAVFLSRLSKAQLAEVMAEAGCSGDAIKAIGKAQKAEAVALAETALQGKTWLPVPLRAPIEDSENDTARMAIAAE
ncbi:ParB/RepB/Spo0J family partition protein (plasmid) [Agrobacterium tumefaciens]|uniref:ParB/RepB/Spo0J family partition protein n=1 Tax=Agrobacterium tumefaciens TaxID=358 RepID=A0AAE6BHR4_AGRTU|nr:ParB/RepB/Spo0J family partition protein [Agrobacterium tumefaciens]QCL82913.1 ParB/RepB/Spo0J family partition protein [Agrobacterium tumefaciens]